ncbi:sugar transferase [Streptomyces sp. NPDC088400]|uniref:sugar transferase n=1 Tax=Streptomyces sp. NPDC088400 TaxID=3365861 RepID=UPI003817CBE2
MRRAKRPLRWRPRPHLTWRPTWNPRPRPEPERFLEPKRLLDLTLGTALLVLSAPVLATAALAMALSRKRPMEFSGERPPDGLFLREYRIGLNGRPFILSSLRTRRFRLDLLSRLPHVVRGDLSLVGPAPLKPGSPAAAAPWRQLVRPGLTGLAQTRRHSALPWDETALLDQHYVEHHWIGLDLAILARSIPSLCLTPGQAPARAPRRPGRGHGPRPFLTHGHRHGYAPRPPAQGTPSDTDHRVRRYIATG